MRKTVYFLCAALAFISVSCDDGPMEEETNPFVGTWEDENDESGGVRYTFTETSVSQYAINRNEPLQFTGTYTYDDTHITITTSYRDPSISDFEIYPNPFVWPYSIENDILTIAYGVVKKVSK